MDNRKLVSIPAPAKLVILGFGSIGQGVLPPILEHIDISPSRITVVSADMRGWNELNEYGVCYDLTQAITQENYRAVLTPLLSAPGSMLLNLSVNVSSTALVELCRELGALYVDTCIEPWEGAYTDASIPLDRRTNYALREAMLALRTPQEAPTAVIAQGANPGIVSQLLKAALMNMAREILGHTGSPPENPEDWARLAYTLGVKVIHIAERDTQTARQSKAEHEFVNTWSIDGFYSEGCQPAEMGWGTHERELPPNVRTHTFGCDAAVYWLRPGYNRRVLSWTPHAKQHVGWMITHNESISIAEYLTLHDPDSGHVLYRPTVHYAYEPCPDAVLSLHELLGRDGKLQPDQRLLMNEIREGEDELGVLLLGDFRNGRTGYWFGSHLSIGQARLCAPYNNATSLQVVAGVLGGMVYALRNPTQGIVEADDLPYQEVLDVALPYLGDVGGYWTDWTPLDGRPVKDQLFPEDLDRDDPWQIKNFMVD